MDGHNNAVINTYCEDVDGNDVLVDVLCCGSIFVMMLDAGYDRTCRD